MPERKFQPGFRLSALDVVVLIVGGIAFAYATTIDRWFGIAIAFVVLHFFLFCNVFRVSRPLELLWAALFASLVASTMVFAWISWPVAFVLTTVATLIVLWIESRRPSYHGIGWRTLNPQLPEWWQAHIQNQ